MSRVELFAGQCARCPVDLARIAAKIGCKRRRHRLKPCRCAGDAGELGRHDSRYLKRIDRRSSGASPTQFASASPTSAKGDRDSPSRSALSA